MTNKTCERRIEPSFFYKGPICSREFKDCLLPNLSSAECPVYALDDGEIDVTEHNIRIPLANKLNAERVGCTKPVNPRLGMIIEAK